MSLPKITLGPAMEVLPPRQRRFVKEYLFDLEQTKAAIRAGYSTQSAFSQASRLMTRPDIQAAIAEERDKRADRIGITADRVLQELAKIAFADIANYYSTDENGDLFVDLDKIKENDSAALTELSFEVKEGRVKTKRGKIKIADKINALINLGKHIGMFKDKLEVSGKLTLEELVMASMSKKEDNGN